MVQPFHLIWHFDCERWHNWLVLSPVDVDTDDEECDAFLFEYKLKKKLKVFIKLCRQNTEVTVKLNKAFVFRWFYNSSFSVHINPNQRNTQTVYNDKPRDP